jgi:aminoglycoside phosphotransferase (APT) family kinase protein
MSVTYSAVKEVSEPEEMARILAQDVITPVLPDVQVIRVKEAKEGRRFEAPRVLWNVYNARLKLPDGSEVQRLFWTKVYFQDADCEHYRARVAHLLDDSSRNPLDDRGYGRFFPDLNMFLFFWPLDPAFPALGAVNDPESMSSVLSPHVRHLDPTAAFRGIECIRVKYLPEISCIVRYDIDVGRDQPLSIYGKVQHSGRGKLTFEVMRCLWRLRARETGDLVVAEPLAYYPENDLVLQSALPGNEISSDRHSDIFMAQCEAAGRTIAHFHNSGIVGGPSHSAEYEINRLYERLEQYKMSSPQLYLMVRDLLKQITAKAQRVPAERAVPSHGDYKYNQFLYDGEKFGLLDVEYFVQAEPSFDLGKYCGHLIPSSPKHWSDSVQANLARQIFLDAYCSVRPEYKGDRFWLYETLALATRTIVVMWAQMRNWEYTGQTLIALAYERMKTRWGE